jgi:ParB family transcriptional regulator, chromosome partitioning protein
MGKADDLSKAMGGIVQESIGVGRAPGGLLRDATGSGSTMPDRMKGVSRAKGAMDIPVEKIDRDPDQPREEFEPDALGRLAESMRTRGQLQPVRVRWDEGRGVYAIVCGERRWRAARMAGLATLQCVVMEGPITPADLLGLQLVENPLREDLRPIEQARAFRSMMERNGWTVSHLARELAVDQGGVSRSLALLDLPSVVQEHVERGDLGPSVAYEVSKLEDPAEQAEVARQAVAGGMNRAEVVRAVRARSTSKPKGRGAKPRKVTSRTFRTPTGPRVVVEFKRGLDDDAVIAALEAALRQVRGDRSESEVAA